MKTFWRCLKDDFRLRLQKTYWSFAYSYVLIKTNIFVLTIGLPDVFKTSCRDAFKTPLRRLVKTYWRYLQDVFKTFSRRLQNIFKTSSRRIIKLNCSVLVFKTFLKRTTKTIIYRRICLDHTSEKFLVSVQNVQE